MDVEPLLSDDAVALYQVVLAQPGIPPHAATARVGGQREAKKMAEALHQLVEMGLVRRESDGGLMAVNPMLAEAVALGEDEFELTLRRRALEQRRQAIRQLVPRWNSALTPDLSMTGVEVVSGADRSRSLMMHFAESSRFEVLSVAPGRVPPPATGGNPRAASLYSLARGVRTRALYQYSAMHDRPTMAYLSQLARSGAQIRFAPSVPGRSLVVDREIAIIPVPKSPDGRSGVALVREPHVVSWIIATFEQLWTEASPMEDVGSHDNPGEAQDQTRLAILRLLAEGEKDEAISRRLSISVRTCRRHIADYMSQVGAASRFQAGVIAARTGTIDIREPGPES